MQEQGDAGQPATSYCWSFGNAEFDESRWQLRVAGHAVELERKPLEVLQYLLRHAGEAVTKEELLGTVWAGRIVVEAVLTNAVGKLRKALRDEAQEFVTTLPRIGYRLSVPVSRKAVEFLPEASRLQVGDAVPRRPNWRLESLLARTAGNEVWLACHAKTRALRVFKFSLAGKGLHALKREVTIARLLREALGERDDFVSVIDWDFGEAPYFVESEYGGLSLDRWPGTRPITDVPLGQRLSLFAAAADAVAAAHSIGVLHKDLKPANLLVEGEGEGESVRLRVADFGSSRLFESGRLEELGITHLGLTQTQTISPDSGTPLYLAPEVAAGHSATIRSDVYALGVTLYQLLVGDFGRPLAPGWERDIDDALLRQDIADAANGDPARRLESAAALAERIRNLAARHEKRALELAVRARVAEGEKRLAKVRARRPWMIAAGIVLVAGLGTTGWQLNRSIAAERVAAEQRDVAGKQARRAEAVVQYLSNDLIRSLAPEGVGYEKDPTIREMIQYASTSLDRSLVDDPATRGGLQAAIGASWESLREPERSVDSYDSAWRAYAEAFGEGDELTLLVRYDLAGALVASQRFDEAEEALDAADRLARARLHEAGKLALWSAWKRGLLLQGRMDLPAAEPVLQRAAQLRATLLPEDQMLASRIELALADVYQRQGKFTEVVARMRAALADPDLRGEELRNDYRVLLAKMLAFQNKGADTIAEAVSLAQAAAASTERLRGPDAKLTLARHAEVARAHSRGGDCASALEVYRRIWELWVPRHGLVDNRILTYGDALAGSEIACGDRKLGLALRQEVFDLRLEHFPDDPLSHSGRYSMARHWIDEGRYRDAAQMLDVIDPVKMAAGSSSPAAKHWIEVQRGRILVLQGEKALGRRRIEQALAAMADMGVDSQSPGLQAMRRWLVEQGA